MATATVKADQKTVCEYGSFSTQLRVVEKKTEDGRPYIQYQKRYWNPRANEGKGGSEISAVNFFDNETEGNLRILAEAHIKMGQYYKAKWLKQTEAQMEAMKED